MLNVYDAIAHVHGSDLASEVHGTVKFLGVPDGTWVEAEIFGLPPFSAATADTPQIGPFAFHIHDGSSCGASHGDEPLFDAHGHWNPGNDVHGNHAGDFPVLFSNGGTAKMLFFTNRFKPSDVIGKTVIIHESPDDYKTQPAGSGGKRIACGVIVSAESIR